MTGLEHARLVDEAWERGAYWERRRIRAAQAKALRELRQTFRNMTGSAEWRALAVLDAATRAPRRSTKKGTP